MTRTARQSSRFARRRAGLVSSLTAASLAAGALTLGSPVATAAPCDTWPPQATGGAGSLGSLGGGSGSAGSSSNPTATPWKTGTSGYIPVLEGRTQTVELLTGRTSPNDTVDRFGIQGTDLGILWDGGDGTTYMALGDTFGDCSLPGEQWRSNILFRSSDRNLADGMRIVDAPMESPGVAKSILPRSNKPGETTVIPTAGVGIGGTQYLRYMSVATWGEPGEWVTNYSALAKSTDRGENWTPVQGTVRLGTGSEALVPEELTVDGEDLPSQPQAQMSAFLKVGGYVYEYQTPSGRSGQAVLARVPEAQIENPDAYVYWDGADWVADPDAAARVIPAPVSELSVDWNDYLGKYIALYTDARNNIVMRQAAKPEGPWGQLRILLSHQAIPTMYGAYIHPWSSGSTLYYTMSTWDAYNVFLMKTDLTGLAESAFARSSAPADPVDTGEQKLVERIPIPE